MSETVTNSNLVQAIVDRKRIRSTNYRGVIIHTTVEVESTWASDDAGSILYIMPIPFSASVKSFTIFTVSATTELKANLGIAGINPDGTFTEIVSNLAVISGAYGAGSSHGLWKTANTPKTIYQILCSIEAPYSPIDQFEPYKRSEFGVLFLKSTTKNNAESKNFIFNMEYVDGNPSESPMIHQTFGAA